MRTNEVLFEQMGLDAILAVSRPATWSFYGVPEDLIVDKADDAWIFRRTLANFGLGKAL